MMVESKQFMPDYYNMKTNLPKQLPSPGLYESNDMIQEWLMHWKKLKKMLQIP